MRAKFLFLLFLRALLMSPSFAAVSQDLIQAIMMESLKSNLVQACEDEKITLSCPRNTHIVVENAFYGRLVPSSELCPSILAPVDALHEDTSCHIPEAHAKIDEACRNKRKCRIEVKPSFFERDACPHTSKYLQISYKCKPISFDDQNFCEGTNMQLNCKQGKRLAIYSAQYGRTINGQAMHCAAQTPVVRDCLADVLGHMLQRCHAQSECSIAVNDHFFGNPCPYGVQKYLSLIFMCVNDEVFSEAAIKGQLDSMHLLEEELESLKSEITVVKDDPSTRASRNGVSFAPPPPPNEPFIAIDDKRVPSNPLDSISIHPAQEADTMHDDFPNAPNAVGVASDFATIFEYMKENKEKTLLYFCLSASAGIILLLLACIVCQCLSRKSEKRKAHTQLTISPECSSLIGSNNTAPMYFDSDSRSACGYNEHTYMRFSQVTPPRVPSSLHYYA
ncbi:hypothetical protein QR680_009938 [Steinernema hermaphroditum]|uniref:SUEL-type lectin domain-containing protein n=1 Tax=Steinernema hermaphroditum TaxID=289476 RepID=A0AA39MAM3_9BILA|nr:hypothetical protein QR680_009938 [Steinernema hermaphroditum]